jgi:hypothetical protein
MANLRERLNLNRGGEIEVESKKIENLGLDKILKVMREIIAEWKKPVGEERDESVRDSELPLAKELEGVEIPEDRKEEVMGVVRELKELGDDMRATPVFERILEKLSI